MKKIKAYKLNFYEKVKFKIYEIKIIKITFIYFSRLLMTISIAIFPKFTHLFSIGCKLPSNKNKITYKKNTLNDWIFLDKNLKKLKKKRLNEEVLVFFKKPTAEFLKYKNKKIKKFLVNWEEPTSGKNIYYTTSDSQAASHFILNKMQPCFYVEPFFFQRNGKPFHFKAITKMVDLICPSGRRYNHLMLGNYLNILKKNKKNIITFMSNKLNVSGEVEANPGSGITVILALLMHFKKVKAFNLHLYQTKKIHKQTFFYTLLSISRHFKAIFYQQHHMENLIYQYIYLANLLDQKLITVTGNVARLNKQKKLISNLRKIIYK